MAGIRDRRKYASEHFTRKARLLHPMKETGQQYGTGGLPAIYEP